MKYRLLSVFVVFITIVTSGCSKSGTSGGGGGSSTKQMNLYVDVKDKHSLSIIKFITDEYSKENPECKINITNALGSNTDVSSDISKGGSVDVLFTSRNTMIELAKKGLLTDLKDIYKKNNISDGYYNIVSSYGRYGDRYYGIGLIPYTIEILYSASGLSKLNLTPPNNLKDVGGILKALNSSGLRVPVALTDDLEIYSGLSSIIASNTIDMIKLENYYNSGMSGYSSLNEMQGVFDNIASLSSGGLINKNTFELGNETSINKLIRGDIPLAICISYYSNTLKGQGIGVLEDYGTVSFAKASTKFSLPVIINSLLCIPTNNKNGEEVTNFVKFVLSDSTQKKLAGQGFITGNKKADENISGAGKSMVQHLYDAGNNSIIYIYDLPSQFGGEISSKIDSILSGKYTHTEWQDIVQDIYKEK